MLGSTGNKIRIYSIILLSIALLFFPAQQGYALFTLTPELNEEQLTKLYKLDQLLKTEQIRDENFVLLIQKNPYLHTTPETTIIFKENSEEKSMNSINRENEKFQLIKDEQITIAEKKYNEILGGKVILN